MYITLVVTNITSENYFFLVKSNNVISLPMTLPLERYCCAAKIGDIYYIILTELKQNLIPHVHCVNKIEFNEVAYFRTCTIAFFTCVVV